MCLFELMKLFRIIYGVVVKFSSKMSLVPALKLEGPCELLHA